MTYNLKINPKIEFCFTSNTEKVMKSLLCYFSKTHGKMKPFFSHSSISYTYESSFNNSFSSLFSTLFISQFILNHFSSNFIFSSIRRRLGLWVWKKSDCAFIFLEKFNLFFTFISSQYILFYTSFCIWLVGTRWEEKVTKKKYGWLGEKQHHHNKEWRYI